MLLLSTEQKRQLARGAGTSVGYLRKLAYGQCLPSLELARTLISLEPRLTYDSFQKKAPRAKGN
jgi:hypothetical protein